MAIMATETAVDFGVDPLPGRELHDAVAALRESQRVAPVKLHGGDALVVTRFEDVLEAFRDEERFPAGEVYEANEPVVGRTFMSMGGREHDAHRKLATPAFRSRSVARFDEEALVPLAQGLIDQIAPNGQGDVFADFACTLPIVSLMRKLAIPARAERQFQDSVETMLTYKSNPAGAAAAAEDVGTQLEGLLGDRRDNPGDDLLSELATSAVGGESLSDDEICSTVRLLFAVGASTTAHAIGNLLSALLERPELLERATNHESSRAGIVHELLRWDGPQPMLPRIAAKDIRFAGVDIPGGTTVLFGLASANRDPRVFDDPDTFDAQRTPGDILTFGFGGRFCPGSHIARRELLVGTGVLLERCRGLHVLDTERAVPVGGIERHPPALYCGWDG
jgi:cytochrome P450